MSGACVVRYHLLHRPHSVSMALGPTPLVTLTFDGVWHFGEVFSSRMNGGGGVMVWAGIYYGQRAQVHFIDGILNAQRYRNEILRPIFVPFIHNHHLMLQHDNARPHVARICTQFLEAEIIPVLAWPAYSPDMSPIEHVWDALDRRICQLVPVPAKIHQLRTAIEEEWTNIPQATINNLINSNTDH